MIIKSKTMKTKIMPPIIAEILCLNIINKIPKTMIIVEIKNCDIAVEVLYFKFFNDEIKKLKLETIIKTPKIIKRMLAKTSPFKETNKMPISNVIKEYIKLWRNK